MEKLKGYLASVGVFFIGLAAFIWAILRFNSKSEISSETKSKDTELKDYARKKVDESKKHEDNAIKIESAIQQIEEDEEWHKKR